ncbi:MAG: Cell division protein FtsQ [Pseudomonadota bacterium]
MSTTRVKRSRPVAKRAKAPAKRRNRIATKSRVDAFFAALPFSPATMQRVINLSVAAVLLVIGTAMAQATGVTAKVQEEWVQAVGRAGFQVRKVEVVGADRIDRIKIYDIALNQQNRSMAAVDLDALRHDLLKYGWVKDARVSRRLPETLVIDIVERAPAAVWQHEGKLTLIDADGVALERISAAMMPDLPLVIGPNANHKSKDLQVLLANADSLRELLAGATWVGNRRWDLRFESGETLALPAGDGAAREALTRFAHMDGANRLLGRGIVRFDMRDPKRFVLRLPPEGRIGKARIAADAVAAAQAADVTPGSNDEG